MGPGDLKQSICNLKPNDERVLVGFDTSEDASVYKISDDMALVQTLDFITPVVDDPYIFGKIAAANSLSDVFAMGADVKTAMNIVGFDAKNFGTAQSRKRSICLISKGGTWQHPKPLESVLTLRDVISHLPSLQNGEHSSIPWHFAPNHHENHVKWMSATPEGETAFNNVKDYPQKDGRRIKGFMTTYKRMYWNKPAPTVTMTNGSISSQNNVHPKDPRVLSIRELLCVCGLPEDCLDKFAHLQSDGSYQYDYKPNFIRKVIGEIFLPKMSYSILNTLPRNSFS